MPYKEILVQTALYIIYTQACVISMIKSARHQVHSPTRDIDG